MFVNFTGYKWRIGDQTIKKAEYAWTIGNQTFNFTGREWTIGEHTIKKAGVVTPALVWLAPYAYLRKHGQCEPRRVTETHPGRLVSEELQNESLILHVHGQVLQNKEFA